MNRLFMPLVWAGLLMAGCQPSTSDVQLAPPLGPAEEKAAIDAFRKAWTQGEGEVGGQPLPPAGTAPDAQNP